MMHEVKCDLKRSTSTYPKGKDSRDKSAKDFLERARQMADRLAHFLADRNAKRKAAREQKRTMKGASSSKATSSTT
jgi:F0F1-type ATP synthase membrane subunit b/b'